MKTKRTKRHTSRVSYSKPLSWLPIDSRLFLPFLKLERVSGFSRFFLEFEITLCVVIVIGTLIVAGLKVIQVVL